MSKIDNAYYDLHLMIMDYIPDWVYPTSTKIEDWIVDKEEETIILY